MTNDMSKHGAQEQAEIEDERSRKRLVWLSESAMVILSVLVFFGFLELLISAYFPQGTSLMVDPNAGAVTATAGHQDINIGLNSRSTGAGKQYDVAIVNIQRRVQHREANSLSWGSANVGDTVVNRDALQTFARSTAVMNVADNGTLTMGENSLIVFDQPQADPFLSEQNAVLMVIDGELSGTLSDENDEQFEFDVGLQNGGIRLQPRTPGDDVQFLITVNEDLSTTVNIHEGTAQVVNRDGTRMTIGEQQSLTIDAAGTGILVSDLSDAPQPASPADDLRVTYRNTPDQILFRWNEIDGADRCHIVIARDPEFSDRVVDDDVVGTSFSHSALGAGTYYWHVRSRAGWSQSSPSAVRKLQVVQDRTPPHLELDPPPDTAVAGAWHLRGRTDTDARVFVDDVLVEHASGLIDHPVELRPGANIIVVEALDNAGNVRYAPLFVTAK